MSIFMLGIDHNMAPVDIRALFAFTRKNTGEALQQLHKEPGICGCIILSTCNRLELWVSTDDDDDDEKPELYQWLCSLKGVQEKNTGNISSAERMKRQWSIFFT